MQTKDKQAKNLPRTRCNGLTGNVINNSIVPERRSSLQLLIVKAETKNIKRSGIHSNRGRISTTFRAKKLSTQKKTNIQAIKNTPKKIKATGDEKYCENSFFATALIFLNINSP